MPAKGGPGRRKRAKKSLTNYRDEEGRYQLSELKPWHERVVDFLVLNPPAKIVDVAEVFGVTPEWMGQVMQTDMFRAYYAKRMQEHQGLMHEHIVSKMQEVAGKSLDALSRKISVMSVDEATKTTELVLKGLGYVQRPGVGNVNVSVGTQTTVAVTASQDAIERARQEWKKRNEERESDGVTEGLHQQVTANLNIPDLPQIEDAEIVDNGKKS